MDVIKIREIRGPELDEAGALFDTIWRFDPGAVGILGEVMRGYANHGHYAAGAFLNGRLVGASIGQFSAPGTGELLSYITGALPNSSHAGLRLKRHQRQWAMERGVKRIVWTFDPLVSRNAHFNLVKLGAVAENYLENYYGEMADAINKGVPSDRLMAVWDLEAADVVRAAGNVPVVPSVRSEAEPFLTDRNGYPHRHDTNARTVLIQVPTDIERLREENPEAAKEWRMAVRETMGRLLGKGAVVLGFHDKSSYVVRRD